MGRAERAKRERRQVAEQQRELAELRALAEAREGRSQAWADAYAAAAARADQHRRRERGPWTHRGSRLVRCAVADDTWQRFVELATQHDQPASAYLGDLVARHVRRHATPSTRAKG